jgi:hypothetical protein
VFKFWRYSGRKMLLRIEEEKCNDEGKKQVVGRVGTMKRQKLNTHTKRSEGYVVERK